MKGHLGNRDSITGERMVVKGVYEVWEASFMCLNVLRKTGSEFRIRLLIKT